MENLEPKVAVWQSDYSTYPEQAPFHPSKNYPEYSLELDAREENHVYDAIRNLFHLYGLDDENYGKPEWNPLKQFINKDDKVLLKPNLVKEFHPRDPEGWRYVLTHGSVIRAVADYVFKALEGTGKVIVADAPQTDSSFSEIVKILKLDQLAEFYQSHDLNFELIDLRKEEWLNESDVIVERKKLSGDPNSYLAFDLAHKSEFFGHNGVGKYYGADYDAGEVNRHHNGEKNEYLIAGTSIKCDVFFNLPKLKTHKKAGVTINLKNLVGVNGDKNWLPHHTEGDPSNGGDQFPSGNLSNKTETGVVNILKKTALNMPGVGPKLMKAVRPIGKKIFGDTEDVIRSGNWHGNDTVWRMCLDLNKLVMYGDENGQLKEDRPKNRKRYLCLVDGFIGGQGRGPMNPDPIESRLMIFGSNPVVTDSVSATLMGFDINKIPIIKKAFDIIHYPLTTAQPNEIKIKCNNKNLNKPLPEILNSDTLSFEPHFGWKDTIEKTD